MELAESSFWPQQYRNGSGWWLKKKTERLQQQQFTATTCVVVLSLVELEEWSSVRFHLRMMMIELMWAMRTQEGKAWGACQWVIKTSGCRLVKKSSWTDQICRHAETCQSHIAEKAALLSRSYFWLKICLTIFGNASAYVYIIPTYNHVTSIEAELWRALFLFGFLELSNPKQRRRKDLHHIGIHWLPSRRLILYAEFPTAPGFSDL